MNLTVCLYSLALDLSGRADLPSHSGSVAVEPEVDTNSLSDDSRLELSDVGKLLDRIRGLLPARVFAVLWLRYAEGWTLAAIGRQMGFSHQYAA